MKMKLLFSLLFLSSISFCQIPVSSNLFFAKEYSKEIALYSAKEFTIMNILNKSTDPVQFTIDPLAAASSGELTTLVYLCEKQDKEGLVLGFYKNSWYYSGTIYSGFGFKNIVKSQAIELLNKIDLQINANSKYLNEEPDNNNFYFMFDDMTFLIFRNPAGFVRIRIFWNNFDSDWDYNAFIKTKKRLSKKFE